MDLHRCSRSWERMKKACVSGGAAIDAAMQNPESPQHADRICPVCAEPMKRTAIKCVKCGSYRSRFRRLLDFTNTTLALLLALLSVSGIVVPVILDSISIKEDSIHISIVGVTHDGAGLDLLVINSGESPGAIKSVALLPPENIVMATGDPVWDLISADERVVSAGQTRQMQFSGNEYVLPGVARIGESFDRYRVEVIVLRHDSTEEIERYDLDLSASKIVPVR